MKVPVIISLTFIIVCFNIFTFECTEQSKKAQQIRKIHGNENAKGAKEVATDPPSLNMHRQMHIENENGITREEEEEAKKEVTSILALKNAIYREGGEKAEMRQQQQQKHKKQAEKKTARGGEGAQLGKQKSSKRMVEAIIKNGEIVARGGNDEKGDNHNLGKMEEGNNYIGMDNNDEHEECCKQCCGGGSKVHHNSPGILIDALFGTGKTSSIRSNRPKRMAGTCSECSYYYSGVETNYCGDCDRYLDDCRNDDTIGSQNCDDCTTQSGCANLTSYYQQHRSEPAECKWDGIECSNKDPCLIDGVDFSQMTCSDCTSEGGCNLMKRINDCEWDEGCHSVDPPSAMPSPSGSADSADSNNDSFKEKLTSPWQDSFWNSERGSGNYGYYDYNYNGSGSYYGH